MCQEKLTSLLLRLDEIRKNHLGESQAISVVKCLCASKVIVSSKLFKNYFARLLWSAKVVGLETVQMFHRKTSPEVCMKRNMMT